MRERSEGDVYSLPRGTDTRRNGKATSQEIAHSVAA